MSNLREERLEYILKSLANKIEWCVNPELLSRATVDYVRADEAINEAKQAITSLIKELVAGAKPAKAIISDDEMGIDRARKSAANQAIDEFEQNLLKELEEL